MSVIEYTAGPFTFAQRMTFVAKINNANISGFIKIERVDDKYEVQCFGLEGSIDDVKKIEAFCKKLKS